MIDFGIDPDLEARVAKLRETLREQLAPGTAARDLARTIDDGAWQALVDSGYVGAPLSADHGGQGLGLGEHMQLMHELAWADPSLLLLCELSQTVAGAVLGASDAVPAAAAQAAVAQGRRVAFAVAEPGAGSDLDAVATTIAASGQQVTVAGHKAHVLGGRGAAELLVYGKAGEDPAWVLVPADAAGVSLSDGVPLAGFRAAPLANVTLNEVAVPAERVLLRGSAATAALARAMTAWRLVSAAATLGLVERCFEAAREHAMAREQFGKKIAHFQEVHFPIADMRVAADGIRRTLDKAAWAYTQATPDHDALSMMVKNFAAAMGPTAIDKAAQVCGPTGLAEGHVVELASRAIRTIGLMAGTSEVLGDHLAVEALEAYR